MGSIEFSRPMCSYRGEVTGNEVNLWCAEQINCEFEHQLLIVLMGSTMSHNDRESSDQSMDMSNVEISNVS